MRDPSNWHEVWMQVAQVISHRSKDPSTQVGAVLVSPDNRRIAVGYNGFVVGAPESPERWERPTKYAYVCHAEINAILNARTNLESWTLYVTLTPCKECAKYVAQSGIKRVIYARNPESYSELDYEFTRNLFRECGVELIGPIEGAGVLRLSEMRIGSKPVPQSRWLVLLRKMRGWFSKKHRHLSDSRVHVVEEGGEP